MFDEQRRADMDDIEFALRVLGNGASSAQVTESICYSGSAAAVIDVGPTTACCMASRCLVIVSSLSLLSSFSLSYCCGCYHVLMFRIFIISFY